MHNVYCKLQIYVFIFLPYHGKKRDFNVIFIQTFRKIVARTWYNLRFIYTLYDGRILFF